METKICKQCGEQKPTTMFRPYYGGRKGTYKTCKACEKINSREKYLARKADLLEPEQLELSKIHQLWDIQRAAGLQPPRTTKVSTSLVDDLDAMMSKYTPVVAPAQAEATQRQVAAPPELTKWLNCELTEEPDYYLDNVYESLRETYRPIIRIENGTTPVYDETHRQILDQILDRFYDYEDSCYNN